MQSRRLIWLALATVVWLAGCGADPNKIRVVGKREDVLPETIVPNRDAPAGLQVTLPPPDVVLDWPGAGGYPPHAMLHLALGSNPHQAWRTNIGDGSGSRVALVSAPIVARGVVYAMDSDSHVSAVRLSDGHRYWTRDLAPKDSTGGTYGGGVAYDGGAIYATTGYGQLLKMDARTGQIGWRTDLPAPARGSPTVRAGRVLALTVGNQTVAFDATNGKELWRHSGNPETSTMVGAPSPAIDGNTVVVAYSSGEIYGLRIENGTVLWSDQLTAVTSAADLANMPIVRGLPVIEDGRVFAAGNAGTVAAFDLASGKRLWDRAAGSIQTPWVAGDFVFLVTNAPALLCFQASTGQVVWATPLQAYDNPAKRTGPIVWSGPVLGSNRLIVAGSNGQAIAVSPYTGKVIGVIDLPDGVEIPPVLANRSLIFLTDGADLVAYR